MNSNSARRFAGCVCVLALLLAHAEPAPVLSQTIRFTDVTSAAGIPAVAPNGYGHGTSFADYNGDGQPDIFSVIYATNNFLLRNNGNGTFTDIAASAGLQGGAESDRGTATADYDNDGDEDIYISVGYQGNFLFRNNGNSTFSDVASSAAVRDYGQGQGVAWGDYNNDGLLDLFVCNSDQPNHFYRQNADHTFVEVNAATGIGNESNSARPLFFDLEYDGDLDLLVVRGAGFTSLLYVNQGNGHFVENAAAWGLTAAGANGGGAAVADYDRDGDLDIYMSNNSNASRLYKNLGGHFQDVAASAGVTNGDGTCIFADYNDDGWQDLCLIYAGVTKTYQNNGDGTFTDAGSPSGINDALRGWGSTTSDYDGDGDLDVFITNSGQNSVLLQNQKPGPGAGNATNWLQVRLLGQQSNRDGVGARLVAWTGAAQQSQWILASGSYDLTAHFGLGENSYLDSLFVYWPSGIRDRFFNINANQNLTIVEGTGGIPPPPDATPPIISSVAAGSIGRTSASIRWTTDEASDSQVEYGLTAGYGAMTPLDHDPVTSHSVALSGLTANTTYHYRVSSRDAAGNLAVSDDFSFTTSNTSILFSDDFNSGSLDASKWRRSSNPGNQSVVANNRLELRTSGRETGAVATQEAFLGRNTTITVKVVQPNDDGNLGIGPVYPFSAACYQFYIYREVASGPYRLYAQWKKNGVLDGFDITGNMVITGVVYMRLRLDETHIHFEASLDGETWLDQYHEPFGLPGYTLDHSFYYELAAYNTPQKGVWIVDDFAIASTSSLPDTLPPQISQVAQSNITNSSATITWATDEASDSQVEYGLTTAYGSTSPLDESQVISHAVALSGLTTNSTYHYRVRSQDASGNLALSDDFSFTTSNTSILFADDFNSGSLDTNKWQRSTNPGNQSVVANNRLELRTSGRETGSVATREAHLGRNTTITVKVVQPNGDGNLGMGPIYPFSAACYQFYIYREVASGPYRLYVQWKKNGVIDGLDITGNVVITGVVYMRLRLDDTHIHFEASLDGETWLDQYHEPFGLPGYTLDRSFYYELAAYNTPQKGVLIVDDFVIASISSLPDTLPPQISQVAQSNITNSSATIIWTTDEASDSQVEYGLTTAYGSTSPLDGNRGTSHSVALSGLTTNTTYHYRVLSRDAAGNLAVSEDFTFTTSNTSILFADDFNSGSLDASKWRRSTNPGNQSVVANNRLELRTSGRETGAVATQEAFLGRNTTITVKVVQPNDDGNLGMGPLYPFSAACYQFYIYREVASGPYRLYAQWKKNGVLDGLDITGNMVITGVVYMRLRLDDTHIHFEASLDGETWLDQYNEPFGLPGYTLDHSFYCELAAYNTPQKGVWIVDDFAIATTNSLPDSLPPQISNVAVNNVTNSTATVTWNTNEPGDSQVEYGTTTGYGAISVLQSSRVTSHSVSLSGLDTNTSYHYRVRSKDASGNLALSDDSVFTTLSGPRTLVALDDFNRTEIGPNWTLDPAAWAIKTGELGHTPDATLSWRYLAVCNAVSNGNGRQITEVSHRWGQNVDAVGVREGAMAVMLDANSAHASGYWIWHRYGQVWLWTIKDGEYVGGLDLGRWNGSADPVAGDIVTIMIRQEAEANYFDYYINGNFSATAVDPAKHFPTSNTWYTGFFLRGEGVHNEVDDFRLTYIEAGALDSEGPQIADFKLLNSEQNAVTLAFKSNEPARAWVEYGLGDTLEQKSGLALKHGDGYRLGLQALWPDTIYHYRLRARDASGNETRSDTLAFRTRPSSRSDFGLRLEAEYMPIATAGQADTSCRRLWSPGYVAQQVHFPAESKYRLTLRGRGNLVGDKWTTAELRVDQKAVAQVKITAGDYRSYVVELDVPAGVHEIAIALAGTETSREPLHDSSVVQPHELWVDWVRIEQVHATVAVGTEKENAAPVPERFSLTQNYPNPFNLETRVKLELPEAGRLQMIIYNVSGQEVIRLHEGEFEPGYHVIAWHGRDVLGHEASSGIYLLRVIFEGNSDKKEVSTKRMVLMK